MKSIDEKISFSWRITKSPTMYYQGSIEETSHNNLNTIFYVFITNCYTWQQKTNEEIWRVDLDLFGCLWKVSTSLPTIKVAVER